MPAAIRPTPTTKADQLNRKTELKLLCEIRTIGSKNSSKMASVFTVAESLPSYTWLAICRKMASASRARDSRQAQRSRIALFHGQRHRGDVVLGP